MVAEVGDEHVGGSTHPRRWFRLGAMVIIILASVAAYSNSFSGPFLFDDVGRIEEDQRIRSAWPPWPVLDSSNRPFAHYTFALNYAAHGYDVVGYHVTNLVIHILAALVLFGIIERTWNWRHRETASVHGSRSIALALAIALLWSVHPINTQAVSYIVQRLESMMGLCYLLTLYGFVRAQQAKRWKGLWYGLSLFSCALGMGCKEVMVTAPVVVMWFDRSMFATSWRDLVRSRWAYYGLLASSWGVLAWAMLHNTVDYKSGALMSVKGLTPWSYLANQSAVITHYLQLVIWPAGQCAFTSWPIETSLLKLLPTMLFVGCLFLLALGLSWRWPAVGFIAMSFFIVLSPTSSIVPIIDLSFEHRMYLPSIAVIALLVLVVDRCSMYWASRSSSQSSVWRPALMSLSLILVATGLGAATYARNTVYSSALSFWQDTCNKAPHNFSAWLGLGTEYTKSHDDKLAEACFVKAIELAPDKARPNAVYAGFLISQGDYQQAAEYLNKAAAIEANLNELIINKGLLLSLTGEFAEAQAYLEEGVRIAPGDEELQTNLIVNLCYLQRLDDALRVAEANLERRPGSARATNDVGACWLAKGDTAMAEVFALKACEMDPKLARALATLGMAMSQRDPQAAMNHLVRASELEPRSHEIWVALGNLTMPTDPATAVQHYEKALALQPADVETMLRLAMANDTAGHPEKAVPILEQALKIQPELQPVQAYLRSLKVRLRGKR